MLLEAKGSKWKQREAKEVLKEVFKGFPVLESCSNQKAPKS